MLDSGTVLVLRVFSSLVLSGRGGCPGSLCCADCALSGIAWCMAREFDGSGRELVRFLRAVRSGFNGGVMFEFGHAPRKGV